MTESPENLARRLATLERKHVRLKWLWGATVILTAIAYPAYQARSSSPSQLKAIHATAFIVDGPNGHSFARLDSYGLHLYSSNGKDIVDLVGTGKAITNSALCLLEQSVRQSKTPGKPIKGCTKHRPVTPSLVFHNGDGAETVNLASHSDINVGEGGVLVLGSANKASFYSDIIDSQGMNLIDSLGGTFIHPGAMSLTGARSNKASISLSSANLPPGPSIEIDDKKGRTRAIIGTSQLTNTRTSENYNRPPSSIVLFDKKGKVFWEVPTD